MKKGDYFEKIDYELVDVDNIDPLYRYDYALDMLVWSQVMAYRTDAFKGAVPNGWADFWDTKKFPGDRAHDRRRPGGAGAGVRVDGRRRAARQDLSDRHRQGFRELRQDQGGVVKWWETGAVPVQMLTDHEVVLASVWNGRMAAIQAAGVPAAISWNQGC